MLMLKAGEQSNAGVLSEKASQLDTVFSSPPLLFLSYEVSWVALFSLLFSGITAPRCSFSRISVVSVKKFLLLVPAQPLKSTIFRATSILQRIFSLMLHYSQETTLANIFRSGFGIETAGREHYHVYFTCIRRTYSGSDNPHLSPVTPLGVQFVPELF